MEFKKPYYKFTAKGDKVLVTGKLNNQFTCQKILIVNKEEVTSKSVTLEIDLFDTPPETWYQRHERELKAQHDIKVKELEMLERRIYEKTQLTKSYLTSLAIVKDRVTKEKLDHVIDLLSGSFTHYVESNYGDYKIMTHEILIQRWDGRFDGLKLVSAFGASDGNIQYRLNEYKDGSGSSKIIYPCRSLREANAIVKNLLKERLLQNRDLDEKFIELCNKHKVIIAKPRLLNHYQKQLDVEQRYYDQYIKDANQRKEKINLLVTKIKSI